MATQETPSPVRLFKAQLEFQSKDDLKKLPTKLRGFYVLYKVGKRTNTDRLGQVRKKSYKVFDVVYVGIARTANPGVRGRLASHKKSSTKGNLWTHFSAFELWDNIRDDEVVE